MKYEPLISISSIVAGATAVLALLVAFGVPLTEDQKVAILGLVGVLAPVIVALVTRGKVTPNAAVVEGLNSSGIVYAGEANELPTGEPIRESGSLHDNYVPDEDDYQPQHADEGDAEPAAEQDAAEPEGDAL
jgi:hypothetical protein